jgi:pyrroline-5-carboxylate reductase
MIASGMTSGDRITVSSKSPESSAQAALSLGVNAATSNAEAVRNAGVVFLCVKPAQALEVLRVLSKELNGKLVISIVAGTRAQALRAAAGEGARILRAMPNTAVRLRKGVTAIAPDVSATPADLEIARQIFSSVGSAIVVREEDLDTVTAVSGSGPAFALLMLEALAQGGIDGGLDAESAKTFAAGALAAAAALVQETGEAPSALRAEITSPAGTTAAGLGVLEESGFPRAVQGAVDAARRRSIELSALS